MYENYLRAYWEKYGFITDDSAPVENGHCVIVKAEDGRIYRFRVSSLLGIPYDESVKSLMGYGLTRILGEQYGEDTFIASASDKLPQHIPLDCDTEIYMAEFWKDNDTVKRELPGWLLPIQAGAALTDKRITEICDNTGDNISARNGNYSEATALYWIWKNTSGQDYVGLFHYRRMFAADAACMAQFGDYDMITTIPAFSAKPLREIFTSYMVIDMDWQLMMTAIEQDCSEYYEDAVSYERSHFYFPCNLFLMKREYFDEMCAFIFRVTFDIEEFYEKCGVVRKERYLGYLVENLMSIYIMHNRYRLKKGCVDMKYYEGVKKEE